MDGSIALDNFKYSFNLNSPNVRIIGINIIGSHLANEKSGERERERERERGRDTHRDTEAQTAGAPYIRLSLHYEKRI